MKPEAIEERPKPRRKKSSEFEAYKEEYVEEAEPEEEEAEEILQGKKKLTYICPSCNFSTTDRSSMVAHLSLGQCMKADELESPDQIGESNGDIGEEEEEAGVEAEAEVEEEEREEEELLSESKEESLIATELSCAKCGFSSFNQDDLDFHSCSTSTEQMFSCPVCTYECPTRTGLQSHITRKHKPRPESGQPRNYTCDECDFNSTNKNTLYSHKRKHRRGQIDGSGERSAELEGNYFCNECSFSTRSKGALYLHIHRRHKTNVDGSKATSERPEFYSCEQCEYTNKNKYEMKVHVIRKHTNEYNHKCEICGKKYKIRGDLTNHIRFQHREQPIICDVCGKTCGNSNSLYVHQKFAHYKAEFECPICHRRMVSQANLDEHVLKQHEQREDAVCEECGKTFTRQSRLKVHMRVHTGLKPHLCKICGKAFSRKTALRQHLLIHTGQRPYVCDICGKTFTQKPGLISHRKSHPGSHPPLPRVTIDHVLSELLTEQS